jgi:hypothetical protein
MAPAHDSALELPNPVSEVLVVLLERDTVLRAYTLVLGGALDLLYE